MKDKLFESLEVGFIVRSPMSGKVYYATADFATACYAASALEKDRKQAEIVVVPICRKL